jgi:hypothetical protein
MNVKSRFQGVLCAGLIVICAGCGKSEKATTTGQTATVTKDTAAKPTEQPKLHTDVCLWDKAGLKADPTQKGKYLSDISLGEQVTFLGDTAVDASDKNKAYRKVRLSDNKEGWVQSYLVETDAKPAAVTKATQIYKRPDLATVSNEMFDLGDFIALGAENGDWVEAVGSKRKKKGWIKKGDGLSFTKEDVTVSILIEKAFAEESPDKQKAKLEDITKNAALASSMFVPSVKALLASGNLDRTQLGNPQTSATKNMADSTATGK